MKKLYVLAALLMATTSAQAGGISFQINGERIRVEAPRNCNAISCVKVISPGYTGTLGNVDLKGMGKKKSDDDDVVTSVPAAPAPAPAPVQAAAPPPPAPAPAAAPAPVPTTVAAATPRRKNSATSKLSFVCLRLAGQRNSSRFWTTCWLPEWMGLP